MDNLSLMTLLLAVATFLLAVAAFWSIWQNRSLHKRERRERLLNEIIEWATEAAKSAIYRQKTTQTQFWKTKSEYKLWMAKSKYITVVTTSSFEALLPCVENINCKLDQAINAIEKELDKKNAKEISTEGIKRSEGELTETVKELFKKAAKIKTR